MHLGRRCSTGALQGPTLRCCCGLPARWRRYTPGERRGWMQVNCAHAAPHAGGCAAECYDIYYEHWTPCICQQCRLERENLAFFLGFDVNSGIPP